MTEIDITMLTKPDLYMTKVVVQHGTTFVDKSIEMIGSEHITLWVEEDGGRSRLRILWNLKYGHYT